MAQTTQSQTAQAIKNFSLTQNINCLCSQWNELKQSVLQSEQYKTCQETLCTVNKEFVQPFYTACNRNYHDLPQETTKLKLSYLQDYSYQQRLIALNVLTIGSALLTIRRCRINTVFDYSFRTLKNSALTYVIGGLFIAPEVFNPLMKNP